jgi:hypothetical protein
MEHISSLEVRDEDSTGLLQKVMNNALEEDMPSLHVEVVEADDSRYLLSILYEDMVDIQDLACKVAMLCMDGGIYHFAFRYMGKEGGVA